MYRFRGSHEVRVGGSLGDPETSLCSADNAGQCRGRRVCGLWGLADPTSTSHVILENLLKRQYLKNTASLRCKMEINVPTLYSKLVLLFKSLSFLFFMIFKVKLLGLTVKSHHHQNPVNPVYRVWSLRSL